MENRPVLRDIDLFALEHRIDLGPQTAFIGQLQQKRDGLARDAIFRVVQIKADVFDYKAPAAFPVISKELSKMQVSDLVKVSLKSFPRWTARERLNGWSHIGILSFLRGYQKEAGCAFEFRWPDSMLPLAIGTFEHGFG